MKNFLYRHKTKFLVSGVLIGGTVLISRYAQRKLTELREREAKEFIERTRRRHHFENTEETCNRTIVGLWPSIEKQITTLLDTSNLVKTLREGSESKVVLWEELKIMTFSQITALTYANAMMATLLRIQLNLIGGSLYHEIAKNKNSTSASSSNEATQDGLQHAYLSHCRYFIDFGLNELCQVIKNQVGKILANVSLKRPMSLQDTEQFFWAIQGSISSDGTTDPIQNLTKYIVPPQIDESMNELSADDLKELSQMSQETQDLLESDEVRSLTLSCINRTLSSIMDLIADAYTPPSTSDFFVHPNSVVIPMAKLIPIVNRVSHDQSWTQQVILDEKLRLFGANVYESFCQG